MAPSAAVSCNEKRIPPMIIEYRKLNTKLAFWLAA